MDKEKDFIIWFEDLGIEDVPYVGGKNAALGEMLSGLKPLGISIPNGFAITSAAYRHFIKGAGLDQKIRDALEGLDTHDVRDLAKRGAEVRSLILNAKLPEDLKRPIIETYKHLGTIYTDNPDVAVRSSATAEDLPGASFAGQQETYLNIVGAENVLIAVKKCFASLFTNRAISYRVDKGFSHFDIALSVGVQKMVRSDLAASGVAFSIDTETGFDKLVVINSSYGLGEFVVQGKVTPDEFSIFKPTLREGHKAIIGKDIGSKEIKMVYKGNKTKSVRVGKKDRNSFSLSDDEIVKLADWVIKIEDYFSQKHGKTQAMDIEWAKDGKLNELFIVQARPETVHSTAAKNIIYEYKLKGKGSTLVSGAAVGSKIASGKVNIIRDTKNIHRFEKGEILVTDITDPDWEPIMKIASAIVTNKGGRTSHAAIVSRELGIPCIVGTKDATKILMQGKEVTVDCSSGKTGVVYSGKIPFEILEHHIDKIPETRTKISVNVGSPDEALKNFYLPIKGVGLGRLEFIIISHIRIHPNALIDYETLKSKRDILSSRTAKQIQKFTTGYKDKKQFYVDKLAEGIAKISSVAWPESSIIRMSDFKTNEYRTLIGGELYEPEESNPMIGWRGASRYYDPKFKEAFKLECLAIKKVRDEMGLRNVIPMVPFCRTTDEARKVLDIMKEAGLDKEKDSGLQIYVMCEVPSNVILADAFLDLFDGFSIGSNDLTQLALGLDRDSEMISKVSNENDDAVKALIETAIDACRKRDKYVGICGQAPSDYPDFARFLIEKGIGSMSLNPDVILKMLSVVKEEEDKQDQIRS